MALLIDRNESSASSAQRAHEDTDAAEVAATILDRLSVSDHATS